MHACEAGDNGAGKGKRERGRLMIYRTRCTELRYKVGHRLRELAPVARSLNLACLSSVQLTFVSCKMCLKSQCTVVGFSHIIYRADEVDGPQEMERS